MIEEIVKIRIALERIAAALESSASTPSKPRVPAPPPPPPPRAGCEIGSASSEQGRPPPLPPPSGKPIG